jgi:Zn-dependent protease with chaperone function
MALKGPIVTWATGKLLAGAVACVALAGCATPPMGGRARMLDIPMASIHADIGFTIIGSSRQDPSCKLAGNCLAQAESDGAMRFALQVERVAAALQEGAQVVYPDLAQRVPGLLENRFDVYVVAGDEPGSTSSANGRIALNAALGKPAPYDEWLAFVIAREMGHVIARHHEENSAASMATSLILNILLPGSSLLKAAISAGGAGIAASSKREVQAPEADAIALELLAASGFQLDDVALALRIGSSPAGDATSWSQSFLTSSNNLLAEARRVASEVAAEKARAGFRQDLALVHGD